MTANNQRATTEMERTVPIDTDSSADAPPAQLEDAPVHDDIAADIDERTDLCDEAEAADAGDQFEAVEEYRLSGPAGWPNASWPSACCPHWR